MESKNTVYSPILYSPYGTNSTDNVYNYTYSFKPWSFSYLLATPEPVKPKPNMSTEAKKEKEKGIPNDENVYLHLKDTCVCGSLGGLHDGFYPYSLTLNNCKGFKLMKVKQTKPEKDYFGITCECGHFYDSHTHGLSGPCIDCKCPYFTESVKTSVKTMPLSIEEVLKLVPGSTEDDWKKSANGGWVYKSVTVSSDATIDKNAVVYGNAIIEEGCRITGNARVFGNAKIGIGCVIRDNAVVGKDAIIGKHCVIKGNAKVFGTVGDNAIVYGKSHIRAEVVISKGASIDRTPPVFRTQKAKGIHALKTAGYDVPENSLYKIERLKTEKQLVKLVNTFSRPCPVTPRHGFVDSRPIKSLDEAKQLVKETRLADKKAEIVAMPFLKASHSGVWTEGQLSIGTGNDGATSGKNTYVIPVQGVLSRRADKWKRLLQDAGITESPYMELLWIPGSNPNSEESHFLRYVQLRNGPKLPDSIDYIPSEMKVEHIVRAEGDLLAWESSVKTFKPGTVVYHPGGSLSSHYAVHAYLSNIPILISWKPEIGETLKPNTSIAEPNIDNMRKGFLIGCNISASYQDISYIMLAGCHSTAKWLGRHDLILGIAMGACYRLLVTASLGEYRHKGNGATKVSRESVYEDVWGKTTETDIKDRFSEAMRSFDEDSWSGSVGGPRWFLLSYWGSVIYNSLIDGDTKSALEALNKGVNSVHNGGWTFNKFIGQHEMDYTAENPVYALVKIAPILYDIVYNGVKFDHSFEKYKLKKINPETYLDEHSLKKKASMSSKTNGNVCCNSADCCGNPECAECHPVSQKPVYKSCLYADSHEGPEIVLECKTGIFPACKKHLSYYLDIEQHPSTKYWVKFPAVKWYDSCPCVQNSLYEKHAGKNMAAVSPGEYWYIICENHANLYKEGGLYIQELPEVLEKQCDCGEHDCGSCHPDGCDNVACHDCGDSDCQSGAAILVTVGNTSV